MADKKYFWLKLQDDFFDSKRIKKLRKLAGGDTYTIIYLKMQLVAMKKGGILEYTGLEKTFAEELALELDEEPENVCVTVNYLLSCGLLEASGDMEYFVPYAVLNTGSESGSARRVREHRERKSLHCNTDVTGVKQLCNTEIEKEIEIEKEQEIEVMSDDTPPAPPVSETPKSSPPSADYSKTTFSAAMIAKVDEWLQYKKERREGYKQIGLQSLVTQIQNNVNRYGEDAVMEVITASMAANYKGIVFDRLKEKKGANSHEISSGRCNGDSTPPKKYGRYV